METPALGFHRLLWIGFALSVVALLISPLALVSAAVFGALLLWEYHDQIHTWWDSVMLRFDRWSHPLHVVPGTGSPWTSPAKNPDHAALREEYAAIAIKPRPSRGDLATLAEITDGLLQHGDNPLSAPPTLRRQGFAALSGFGSIVGAGMSQWTLVAGLGLLSLFALAWGRGDILKAQRDAPCSAHELSGHTTRQACATAAAEALDIVRLEHDLDDARHAGAVNINSQVAEALETGHLNQRREVRRRATAAVQARAHADDIAVLRDSRAPEWDQRLRDLSGEPAAPVDGADPGASPGAGAPGGVSAAGDGAPVLPSPVAAPAPH